MRYISVCSGIEAATVAWHSLRWKAIGNRMCVNVMRWIGERINNIAQE